jgi:hypothetical protein
MLERTETRFSMKPTFLAADSAYGSAESLAWLVKQKTITPHIPVFDKSNRTDGTFSRADFVFNPERDRYTCPAGKELVQFRRTYAIPRSGVTAEGTRLYRASKLDCDVCKLKAQCCPNALARKIRGICMKMLATWPVRTPQLQNTWRPVAVGSPSQVFNGICGYRSLMGQGGSCFRCRRFRVPAFSCVLVRHLMG